MLNWRSIFVVSVVAIALSPLPAKADVIIWDETVNGNFSNTQSAPTALNLLAGNVSSIIGSTGTGLIDWVTVHVPTGTTMSSVLVSQYVPGDATSFVGFQGGTVFVGSPFVEASFWGYTHFGTGPNNLNTNLLPAMNAAFGVQGFTIPLASGDYAFAIRQAGPVTGYKFEFTVSPVPEPSSMILLGLAGVGAVGRGWKKFRRASR